MPKKAIVEPKAKITYNSNTKPLHWLTKILSKLNN